MHAETRLSLTAALQRSPPCGPASGRCICFTPFKALEAEYNCPELLSQLQVCSCCCLKPTALPGHPSSPPKKPNSHHPTFPCITAGRTATQVAVSNTSHPELLAGMRGAGTVFGIVTEITFSLFDGIDSVYAGNLMLPDDAQHTTFRSASVWIAWVRLSFVAHGLHQRLVVARMMPAIPFNCHQQTQQIHFPPPPSAPFPFPTPHSPSPSTLPQGVQRSLDPVV